MYLKESNENSKQKSKIIEILKKSPDVNRIDERIDATIKRYKNRKLSNGITIKT